MKDEKRVKERAAQERLRPSEYGIPIEGAEHWGGDAGHEDTTNGVPTGTSGAQSKTGSIECEQDEDVNEPDDTNGNSSTKAGDQSAFDKGVVATDKNNDQCEAVADTGSVNADNFK